MMEHEYIISDTTLSHASKFASMPIEGEIIRCRDCKWFQEGATPHDPSGRYNFCSQFGFDFQGSDGFCAWAERGE